MKKLTLLLLFCLSFSSFAQNAAAYKTKAEAFFDKGEFEKAIANLTLALKLNPKDDKALAKRALCYEMIDKLDLALLDNLELLKYDKSGAVYGSIGYNYLWLRKYDDARSYLKQAIALLPNQVSYRYNLALSYQFQKNYEQAIIFYDEALKVSPDHKRSKVSKARCLIFSKQIEKATALIDTFFAAQNFDVEMLVLRADLKKEDNKLDEAFQDYGRALAVLPEDFVILNKYLKCLHALNFHEEEIDVRKREIDLMIKLKIDSLEIANSYALYAIALEESDYLDAALENYNESIKLDPKGGEVGGIYYLRSILKAKLKDFDGACRDLDKAKELNPGNEEDLDQFFIDDEAFADFVEYCMPNL